jgi:hypothetical protein
MPLPYTPYALYSMYANASNNTPSYTRVSCTWYEDSNLQGLFIGNPKMRVGGYEIEPSIYKDTYRDKAKYMYSH